MSTPEFVYTSYIRSTPEQVWRGLTEPAFTERYWGATFESDWEKGSTYVWIQRGVRLEHPDQIVLESDPYERLSFTFHTFTPELADEIGLGAELFAEVAAEPRSRVTYELEALGDVTKLTVVHDDFPVGSKVHELVRGGWPSIISNLKTLLETGETLPSATSVADDGD